VRFDKHLFSFEDVIFLLDGFNRSANDLKSTEIAVKYLVDLIDVNIDQPKFVENRGALQIITLMRLMGPF